MCGRVGSDRRACISQTYTKHRTYTILYDRTGRNRDWRSADRKSIARSWTWKENLADSEEKLSTTECVMFCWKKQQAKSRKTLKDIYLYIYLIFFTSIYLFVIFRDSNSASLCFRKARGNLRCWWGDLLWFLGQNNTTISGITQEALRFTWTDYDNVLLSNRVSWVFYIFS